MKKKLLEKDGFYLSLFVCICLLAIGGVWFTNNNVEKLASNKGEIHLIENDEDSSRVPTATDSGENLEQAKSDQQQAKTESESILNYVGDAIIKGYSEKEPSYSKTLDVWEIHQGVDVASKVGADVKSLTSGVVKNVFNSDKYGYTVAIENKDKGITLVYSNLNKKVNVTKGQEIKKGKILGTVGETTQTESLDASHIHLEAYEGDKVVDPTGYLK
ncbi:MAG: M23 family metallopeptidase [Clostridioides sp.]|nr:M23 family metallopeptidase [Clostridioides sp.]